MAKERKTGGRAAGTPNKGKPGRPSLYSNALAEKICERLSAGETLHEICAGEDMPKPRTVYGWAEKDADFHTQLDASLSVHADWCADEQMRIAKDGTEDSQVVEGKLFNNSSKVQRDRLRVDVLKHRAAVLKPAKYAQLSRLEHSGRDGGPIKSESADLELAWRMAFILARGVVAADAANILRLENKPSEPAPHSDPKT